MQKVEITQIPNVYAVARDEQFARDSSATQSCLVRTVRLTTDTVS
jgi:hypothetical protein